VIYQSTSGVRSIVSRLGPKHHDRLLDIGNCPMQFQPYITGVHCRVHVVSDKVFAAEIASDVDDRYAGPVGYSIDIRASAPEPEFADRCWRLTTKLALAVAGVSLHRAPEGHWFCCEVNPWPGFTDYEEDPGRRIAEAIADLLAVGTRSAGSMRLARLVETLPATN
jgi:hypothetical protein